MTRITGEIVTGAPANAVFGFAADQRNEPAYNPHMVRSAKVTPGRLRWSWDARFTWPLRLLAPVLARVGGPLPCWSYQR